MALRLRRLGITRVRPLAGGYEAWRAAGYPLEPAPRPGGTLRRVATAASTHGVSDTDRAVVKITQIQPCRVELAGAVSIGAGGKTLEASYTRLGCDGAPLKATFTGVRQ